MATTTTIKTFNTAFGGCEYRATSNGETVNIQRKKSGNKSFKTELKMTTAEYQDFAEEAGINDVYGNSNNHGVFELLITERS